MMKLQQGNPTRQPNRKSVGGAYESRGKFHARITVAAQRRRSVLLPWCSSMPDAEARARVLQRLVQDLRRAGQPGFVEATVSNGARYDEADLAELVRSVAGITAGRIVQDELGKVGPETFESFSRKWLSGELHATWPDAVTTPKSADKIQLTVARLYPTIGPVPIVTFSELDAERAMRALPPNKMPGTRHQYMKLIRRVLNLAVKPARLIKYNPVKEGFVTKPPKARASQIAWPSEDAAGLACTTWPLSDRMVFGFLPREGMRSGEVGALAWEDLSADGTMVRLEVNKTDTPRSWVLDPSVATALRVWKGMRSDTGPKDLVFRAPDGRPYNKDRLARRYRDYLEQACHARPEILSGRTNVMRIRAHDMRGMFVTYATIARHNEAWVCDRTGHTTSAMMNRYRKMARTFEEAKLGTLVPMAEAIPEIAAVLAAGDAATDPPKAEKTSVRRSPAGMTSSSASTRRPSASSRRTPTTASHGTCPSAT
jgi:integrase